MCVCSLAAVFHLSKLDQILKIFYLYYFTKILSSFMISVYIYIYIYTGGTRGLMVIVVGNGHCDTSSNPGPD